MRPPETIEELVSWYMAGKVARLEFFPLLLFVLSPNSVGHTMSQVPVRLRSLVVKDAKSLRDARESGKELLDFTFGQAQAADEDCERVIFKWVDDIADVEERWIAGEL